MAEEHPPPLTLEDDAEWEIAGQARYEGKGKVLCFLAHRLLEIQLKRQPYLGILRYLDG